MNAGPGTDPDSPIDDVDEELLDLLRSCHDAADPMPAGLVERTMFALALTDLDKGVVRLAEQQSLETVGARGEKARVITFDGDDLTVLIRIGPGGGGVGGGASSGASGGTGGTGSGAGGGTVRVDGWLAPPGPALVELRTAHETVTVNADDDGRFVFEDAPGGLAQFAVRAGGGSGGGGAGSGLGDDSVVRDELTTPTVPVPVPVPVPVTVTPAIVL